jgi:8-oxo-dGTP pyrophosphatase MutT (NUDIX family)
MPWTTDFAVQHEKPRRVTILDSSGGKATAATVNAAFANLVAICVERNLFQVLGGRHSEPFAVAGARYDQPVYVERFATSLFGLTTRGAHLVAYTETPEGMKIWVPRRSPHLFTYPGMLDTTVAGGVKSGASPLHTLVEEADEEASLSEALIRQRVRSRGVISHMGLTGKGFAGEQGLVTPDYIYVYDIELPIDVVPKPHDDEVHAFYSMSVGEVQEALLRGDFKPDSGAVLVDFLIRHGIITPENEKDFVDINVRLHRRLPFRTGPP